MKHQEADLLTTYDLFIFDLDGTLYDQKKLRNIMLAELIFRFITFRISFRKLKIINRFRRLREQKLGFESPGVHDEQFSWCAESLDIPVAEVRSVIEHWMLDYPLRHLHQARYPKVKSFFLELRKQGRKIAVYSDFPVVDKLKALRLDADKTFCSTDVGIAQLKPSRKGTRAICQAFNCPPEKTIFFGDRVDTDGESARMAGVRFIHVDTRLARKGSFYRQLLNQIVHQDDRI